MQTINSTFFMQEKGIIAMGSGSRDGKLYFIKDLSFEKDVESGPRFKVSVAL